LRRYRRHVPFRARLEFPDGDHEPVDLDDLLQVAVANGRFYGGGNVSSPRARDRRPPAGRVRDPARDGASALQVARHFVSGAFTERTTSCI
jgi:hypothetical protein